MPCDILDPQAVRNAVGGARHVLLSAWDRPYVVDSRKFTRRFWADVTPFEISAAETARWFLAEAATGSAPRGEPIAMNA